MDGFGSFVDGWLYRDVPMTAVLVDLWCIVNPVSVVIMMSSGPSASEVDIYFSTTSLHMIECLKLQKNVLCHKCICMEMAAMWTVLGSLHQMYISLLRNLVWVQYKFNSIHFFVVRFLKTVRFLWHTLYK